MKRQYFIRNAPCPQSILLVRHGLRGFGGTPALVACVVHCADSITVGAARENARIVEGRTDDRLVSGDALPWRLILSTVDLVSGKVRFGIGLPAQIDGCGSAGGR